MKKIENRPDILAKKIEDLTSFVMMQQYEIAKLKKTISIYDHYIMNEIQKQEVGNVRKKLSK